MYFNRKNAEQKNWRMIKKGKHFLFGCSLVFAVGATLATPTVHADNVEAKAEATTSATQAEPTAEAPTYAAPAATSPAETAPVEANSVTTAVSVDKSQLEAVLVQAKAKSLEGQEASVKAEVTAAIAEAEALVANGTASQEQVNQSVERLNQAVASVKEVTEATVETTTEAASEETTDSSETPKVRNKRATSEGTSRAVDETRLDRVTVTKDNFDSFFKEGGTANYDETSGTIKLTDDVSGQVGSAYLRFKIDPREDFTFTGKVDIGDKYEGHTVGSRPGGDGVGFVFHTGNVDTIGQSGASIGMGTIKNAFGFKLDSWHNTSNPNANQNASADPRYGGNAWRSNAFGSFYSSNNAGRVTTSSSAAKALNPKPNGEWVDFKIEYKGQSKEFIVTYGSEKWSTNLKTANASIMEPTAKTALNNSNATYALSFLGSTGSGTNLQRVQIEKFEFTAPQIVQVAFYDEAGNELAGSSAIPGDRNQVVNLSNIEAVQKAITKLKTKGYTLKEVNSDRAETYNAATNTVTLRKGGQLLKYVFAVPTPEVTKTLPSDRGMLPNGGIKSTDNTLSGTGVPGATVTVKVAGATLADNITVATDGAWTTTLPTGFNSNITDQDQLVPKNSVTITQKIGVSESEATEVAVALGESSVVPSTESKDKQSLVAETTTVTLKVPHDAGITYFDYPNANNGRSEVAIKRDSIPGAWTSKDESKAVVKSYSSDGFFDTVVLEMKDKIQAGKAKVVSNIKEGKYTSPVNWKEITVEEKPDTTPPVAPSVSPVTAGATSITGTAEANSKVEATLPNGSKASATADQDGNFSVPVSGLEEGQTVSVTAKDASNNTSTPTTATVGKADDKTAPAAPVVNPVKAGDTAVTGTAEAGSTVEVTLPDGSKATAKADQDGNFSVPVSALKEGDKVSVTATDDAGNKSTPTSATVPDTTAPAAPSVSPVTAGATAVTGTAEAGSTVEVTLPDGSKATAKADQDGNFSVPVSALKEGDKVSVTATDDAGNKSTPTSATVPDTTAPAAPSVSPVTAGATAVTGTAEAGSTVEVTLPDGSKATAKADQDGNFSVPVSALKEGDKVSVTATDDAGNKSTPTSATVPDTTAPAAPSVSPVTAGATAVTGTAEAGSTVEVTLPDGSKATAKADQDGNFSVPVSALKEGDKVSVTATDDAGNKSTPTSATVPDTTAPAAPSVSPVTAGATAVTGTAEAGSTVEVTLPDGSKATAKADQDGNFSVPVSALKEGDKVSVTATDDAGNKSTPTSATVPDTTAPAAPSVSPVTAGATAVTGTAEAGSTVEVTLPDGSKATAKADQDGNFSVPVSALKEGDKVSVTATDDAGNKSTPTSATVPDTTAPAAPSVSPVTAGATAVTGTAEAGSTVEVTLPDGSKATAKADQDGNFSVPVSALKEGDKVSVTATDDAGNKSTPTSATVPDTTAPAAPSVSPVTAGATAVTGTAEAGSTVEVTLPDGSKATAKADQDGNFSVPVSALKEGDKVSVTATDDAGNKSTPTSATVPDTTAPAAPSVSPVTAGATAVTGTAEAGSTVEVTLPDGSKATAKADQDGNFSVPVSALKEGDKVSVTATDDAGNKSTPTSATVPDTTAPAAPSVSPVTAGATAVTGTAEAGSTVEVTLPDGTKASATADQDGNFSVPVSGLEEGQTVSVTAKDASNNTSTPTTATVAKADDKTAPAAPVVNPVKAGDTAVTGTAEAGSTVEVTLPDGTKASATADQDGNFSVPVSGLEEGQTVSVTAKDASNNTSTPTTATVGKADDKTAPAAPVVNPVKAGDTAVTGTAEAGSTVEVTLPDGTKASATADQDGNFSVPVSGLEEGQTVSVTAKDASNNTSTPTTATVAKADDKTAPAAPVVNPVKAGDTAVTGTAEAGSTVEVTLPDGTKASATADQDGNFSVPVSGLEEGQTVSVTAKDASNNTSAPTTATVGKADDKTAPAAPVVNPVKAGDTAVTGTAEAGSTVEVTLPDGTKASATADQDGNYSVPVSGLEEGQTVSVTAKDASNNTSTPTTATVGKADDKTAPAAPVVNPVKAGDTAVTGTAEAGSTVEVTLPDGTKASATADQDGNFSVPVSGLEEGQTVSVTAKDASNNTSTPTTATVGKADDKTAPAAPVVNPVKAGDTAVTGTAEAGSTVEVTLPDGSKATAKADQDGNFSVPVSALKEGDKVSVTATDDAGNKSTPTSATVPDTTAPAAPSVSPVTAGATAVTGTAEAGSTVEVTLPDGSKATAKADQDGNFSVPVSALKEGDKVSVTATDDAGNKSTPTSATVPDTTAPAAPSVSPVTAGATAVTGTAEAGSTVEVTLPDGSKATAKADQDGNFSVPVSALKEGDKVSVTATDDAGNKSTPTSATVPDTTAPAAPSVSPVTAGATAVTGTAEAGSTVEVTLPDGSKATAKADQDGNFSVPVSALKEGDKVSVTATDDAGNKSTPTSATVPDTTAPAAPSVSPVTAGATAVTGTAEAGSTVEVTLPDGSKATAKADQDGNFSVPVSALKEGDKVSVTATDDAGNKSTPTSATVPDTTAPAAPSVSPVTAGATAVTGTAEAGSTVEVTLPDGSKATAKADQDGNFSVPVSALKEGDKVSVTATDDAGNKSTPTSATVPDTTAPAAPSVSPVTAGATAVTGTAEAGSTVEVTLPDGSKATAKADQDGNFSVPVSALKEGDKVSVTATDDAGNKSTPTSATVPDTTAPSVSPVTAGATAVTGTAEAGSTVEVTLPDGSKATAKADQDGNFSVPVSALKEGDKVSVTATDDAGNKSTPTSATVPDTTAPAAPSVSPVTAGATAVTGTAEAGSTVEVTLPDGSKATAKADQDGNFSVPVSALKEGDKVSVTATDDAGNKSTPTSATVPDTTAPAAPSVSPVTAGATAVTGTAEAGSTVEVTLPDGTKASATADQDGNFSVPVSSGLEEGQTVSVTAKDASNNTSTPTTATVAKADDKTAPAAPVVNPVKAGDTAVTGTAEAGSTVEVTLPDGTKASATADQDGNFSVPVSGLEEGQTVSVTAKDASNNTSTPTTATVGKADDKTAPAAPVVNPVKAGDTAVTGTAEAGSTVEVTLPDGTKASATADQDGNFSVPVSGLEEGQTVSVTAKDASNNTSTPTTATVGKADDKTAPAAPVVNPVKAGDTAVTGTAEAGSTVEVTLPDGTKASATADQDGNFSVPVSGLEEGQTVSVTAKDASNNTSAPTTATVGKADDKTAPAAPVVNPVKAGDTAVTGTAEAGSTVEVTLPDGTKASATADQDGNYSVPVSGLEEGQTVSVTAKDASNNTSTPTTATVGKADDKTAPAAPVVNPVKAGDTAVTGTAEAGSTVEVTLPDGTKASATADQDGNFSVPVSGLEEGQTVSVTAKDASNNTSAPTTATVGKADDKTAPAAPVVNPVKAGDTAVTGTAEAGSTVEVTLPDGTKASATADQDGNYSVPVSGLEEGQTVSVTAKDASNNTSTPTTATVGKADDKTAPAAPVVNPVKAGDTAVTGTAEAGSTVEVTLPDGSKATAKADQDGNFSVPVSALKEGDKVSVTATDDAGNKSTPTSATVPDTTAPAAPSVSPVTAGATAVTGTAEAGSTVEVTLPDGSKATAKADQDGNFSVPVSALKEGDKVSVTATDDAGNKSTPTSATVPDTTAPAAPSVSPVTAGATAVTGTAEAGSTVEVTLPDGSKATAKADQDGNFSVPVSALKEGDKVSVTATDDAGNKSTPTSATVPDTTAPAAPSVSPVTAGATAVTGTAEAGSTVEVTLPDGTKASATADQDGNFSVPVSGLEEGQTVSVTAKDASNNTSTPTTATVAKADDKTAPAAPVVNPVKAGDTAVTGTAEAGSTVEVTLPDGTKASATADQDGNFSVPVSGLEEGQTVSVTAKDASNNTSTPTTATVAKADDKTAPAAPVVNPVKAGDTAVTGTAEAGSTVEVTLPDGTKASATADQDGNFSVPVSGLEEGQTVSVTAKDASNNTSTPTTATVAKADDKTAPAAPVVNPVKAGDTAVTGTAEAGSTVEVTLPDGTKASATADQDGNFSVPVSGLEEGQTVSVTAKDASNNTSTPTTATVAKADDKTAPAAPVVNPVKAGDTAVTGTAEAGSTVEVTLPDGTKASATADQDGNFSVPVSGLEEGQTVSVTAKDASNNTSTPTTATVAKADDKTAPAAPVVNPVKAGDTAVTGTAEAGSTVEVTLPDGTKASATADQDGNFSVPVSGLEEGQTVSVTAKDASNNTSTPTTATVGKADDKTAPAAPVVNPVKAGDTAVTGTAEAGSTVEVTLPDGTKASATADQDGNYSVPVSGLEEGQTVSVTAKDASNNTSAPTTATVAKADDKTAPTAPVVNPVKAGDTAVTGTAEAGSTVEVTLPDGTKATATADQDGNFSVPVSGLEEGQTVSVTAKDASNNTSAPTTATVAKADDKTAPDAPVVNPVKAGDTAVTGTAEAGSTVEVTLPDGSKATATADQDGNFSVPVSGLEEGQTVSVTATDAAKNTSAPTTATVAKADDKTAPTAPVVNPVKAGDTAVTGTAEAGSTVEVTLPDGTKATATADQDGNFSVPVSGLEEGQTVSVTAKDASNNTSAPTTATVAKADDKTAPTAPVVNPVKAGDTAVTGTAEAGSTVEVTLPDGTKATATADKDGKFSIPVNGLNAGDTVSVTATDESGNISATTTVTVSNVNVGGKEADNAKVPALTPVVDPNNLTDAEKAKVAEEVKKSNPTAKDIKVNNDGSVVVTFEDGSVAVIPAEKAVAAVNQDSPAQEPAKKAGAKELPNTGTKQSNASLGLALLAAVTGGLLISKKREEEE